MVYLQGNPVALLPGYREIIKQRFENMRVIDGDPAFTEAESPSKKKKRKGEVEKPKLEIPQFLRFDMHFRVLFNVDGVYLNDENCKMEKSLDEVPLERKSSIFWLEFEDHRGNRVKSE